MFGFVSHKGAVNAALLPAGPIWEQHGWLHASVPGTRPKAGGRFLSCYAVASAPIWGGRAEPGTKASLRPAFCRQLCELGQLLWL